MWFRWYSDLTLDISLSYDGGFNWFTHRGRHNFADDIFKYISLIATVRIPIQICFHWAHWQYAGIDTDNGLAPNRWQVIILTNDGPVYWSIYASLGLSDLTTTVIYTLMGECTLWCGLIMDIARLHVDQGSKLNMWDSNYAPLYKEKMKNIILWKWYIAR